MPGTPEARAAGRAILEELRKQTALLTSIEAKVGLSAELLAALTEMQLASGRPPDDQLPVGEDGACPRCGSLKVSVPDESERADVRDCRDCGHAWQLGASYQGA